MMRKRIVYCCSDGSNGRSGRTVEGTLVERARGDLLGEMESTGSWSISIKRSLASPG